MIRFVLSFLMVLCWPIIASGQSCQGSFPNIVTDVCWDCMFPMKFGGGIIDFGVSGDDYDSGASATPVCFCIDGLTTGSPASFWEPKYMLDVTNKPGCMPLLGGADYDPPYNESEYGGVTGGYQQIKGTSRQAFMHANLYINPIMSALGILREDPCLDDRSFDTPYISWADPSWGDEVLSMILTPYAYPFASVLEVASEMPDAIAATVGFPLESLFWVAGAWGPMYPLVGTVGTYKSPEQVSHLILARVFAKLHAAGTMASTAGDDALKSCGAMGFPQMIMDKRQYKTNRVFPFPDNLCTPIGRPLQFQEIGAARPQDKDYGYFVFQKKDCCEPFRAGF